VGECTRGGGAVSGGWGLMGAASCTVVDGWLRGDLRRVGGGRESMPRSVREPGTLFSRRRVCFFRGGWAVIFRGRKFRRKVSFSKGA